MNAPYPPPTDRPYAPDEVRALFVAAGMTLSQWAEANGFKPRQVYLVMGGHVKGKYGTSHEIAVKLGLKLPARKLSS